MIQVDGIFVQQGGGGSGFGLDISVVSELPSTVQEGAVLIVASSYTAVYVDTDTPASPVAGDIWVHIGPSMYATEPETSTRLGLVDVQQYTADGWLYLDGYVGESSVWAQFSAALPR